MKYKNVLMIIPPNKGSKDYLPNLGILYLASTLKSNGIKVTIDDMGLDNYMIYHNFNRYDLICLTCATDQKFEAYKIIKYFKDNFPNIPIVLGGPHFTYIEDKIKKEFSNVIKVIKYEGEQQLLEFCLGKKAKYQEKWPARELVPINMYQTRIEEENKTICTGIITSRGCPNNCMFCSSPDYWKRICRFRDPIDVVDEMEHVVKTYGIYGFDIWDDTFTVSKKHVENICNEIIRRDLKIKFYARIRVNTVNKEILKLMKKAGCVAISFGVESGSEKVLKAVNKNITIEQVMTVAGWCRELKLVTKAFFMINLPGENIFDVFKTVKLVNKLNKMGIVTTSSLTIIYPGTKLDNKRIDWYGYYSIFNKCVGLNPICYYYKRWRIPFYYLIWKLFKSK